MTDRQAELLRGLARDAVRDRRGRSTPELDELVARGLAASAFVGHADIELGITDAGRRALAELDAPVPSSVPVPRPPWEEARRPAGRAGRGSGLARAKRSAA